MKKTIIILCVIAGTILVSISLFNLNTDSNNENKVELKSQKIDVFMPTKVSRPGCEINNSCYIPSNLKILSGEEVTWQNQDSAFHSVTSGKYDSPTELFDSGHLDPDEIFTLQFNNTGIYDYFCTLHPWMEGKVIVE